MFSEQKKYDNKIILALILSELLHRHTFHWSAQWFKNKDISTFVISNCGKSQLKREERRVEFGERQIHRNKKKCFKSFFFLQDIYYYNYKELLKKKIITKF